MGDHPLKVKRFASLLVILSTVKCTRRLARVCNRTFVASVVSTTSLSRFLSVGLDREFLHSEEEEDCI